MEPIFKTFFVFLLLIITLQQFALQKGIPLSIITILKQKNLTSQSAAISNILPKFNVSTINSTRLAQCYDPSFGRSSQELNIFKQPLDDILIAYFTLNHDASNQKKQNLSKKVDAFLINLQHLAENIHSCLNDKSGQRVNKLGLTFLFHLSILEQDHLLAPAPPKLKGEEEDPPTNQRCQALLDRIKDSPVPESFDWRDNGVVTRVRNQEGCGACYIFSTIGALEGARVLQLNKSLLELSEQDLINCYPNGGRGGCRGSPPVPIMEFTLKRGIARAGQMDTEFAHRVEECSDEVIHEPEKPTDYCMFRNVKSDQELKSLLYHFGPVTMPINFFNRTALQVRGPFYRGCGYGGAHHMLLAVGWTPEFFIIKNSWGTDWGVEGYWYLARNEENQKCKYKNFAMVPFFVKPEMAIIQRHEVEEEEGNEVEVEVNVGPSQWMKLRKIKERGFFI